MYGPMKRILCGSIAPGLLLTAAAAAWVIPAVCMAQAVTTETPASVDHVEVYGRADYDWTIRALDDDAVELAVFKGKVLFINLWASWCTPCIRIFPVKRVRPVSASALASISISFAAVRRCAIPTETKSSPTILIHGHERHG